MANPSRLPLTNTLRQCFRTCNGPRSRTAEHSPTSSFKFQLQSRQYHWQKGKHNNSNTGRDHHKSRPRQSRRIGTLSFLAAGSVLIYTSSPATIAAQNVRFEKRIPESEHYTTDDPLSILDPYSLASSTAHLVELPLSQLLRAYVVFLASSSAFLVDMAPGTIHTFEWLRDNLPLGAGRPLWSMLVYGMRQTFFAQFVAGETAEGSFPLLERLHQRGCAAMLNWSAEADHAVVQHHPSPPGVSSEDSPKILKESFEELSHAIKASMNFHPEYDLRPTMLAIKLTGLVQDPAVFERFTNAIESQAIPKRALPGIDSEGQSTASLLLSTSDVSTILAVHQQLHELCDLASKNGVRIAFDAEQSWYQPALSCIVDLLAEEYNRSEIPFIYNTYQTNLKETEHVIREDLARAKAKGYSLGLKIVRGAYVPAENARAAKKGIESKVWPNKKATDACFDACSGAILEELAKSLRDKDFGPSVIYATHNATSIKQSLTQMREQDLVSNKGTGLDVDPRIRGRVSYAQLLGMTDNLTTAMFQLFPHTEAKKGEKPLLPITALYVPYGQIDKVLPYLVRRAQENKSILQGSDGSGRGGAAEQRKAIGHEIRRRMFLPF